MKKLIFCLAVLGAVLSGCSTDDDNENGGGNGGSQTPQLPELPPLPDPNDVCSCMDDIVFMQYCYDNFDVNHDGAVSPTEAAAVPEMILCVKVNSYTYNGLPVKSLTGIGYFTNLELLDCRGCSQLQSVDLRRNRKLLLPTLDIYEGYYYGCFSGCSALSKIFLPDNISSIGRGTFSYCSSLTSITIPDSVTTIGGSAFYDCSSLTSITIPDSVTTIGERVFLGCSSLTSITIPDSVTRIGGLAFAGCSSLTSITISDSVTTIEELVFSECSNLTSITIPDSVTKIEECAFQYCSSLTSITIPDSVTKIESSPFKSCTNLSRFYGKYATSDNRCLVVDGKLVGFAPCDLESYTIPNNVTTIGDWAFYNCSSLTSITTPDIIWSIGYDAFFGCSGLKSFYCKPQTPPRLNSDGIELNNNVVIYVPTESVDVYKTAEYWSKYASQIRGYDF